MLEMSELQRERLRYVPRTPEMLRWPLRVELVPEQHVRCEMLHFPHLSQQVALGARLGAAQAGRPLRVGAFFSGGQAPGGHNVITGLYDTLQKIHQESRLFGFVGGPSGVLQGNYRELNGEALAHVRNQGGFDLIGSGRTKIESAEQFAVCKKVASELNLDGLVVIGGDDSQTNAAHLAEYFLATQCGTAVVGVPKTIDGDLQNEYVEMTFGFDTACKTYSETIGNIAKDAVSAKKYYFFIKLMGRSASHVTLECALQTHPNLALIGEELWQRKATLFDVANEIADLVIARAQQKKNYGVILVPEGIIEFVTDIKALIAELNRLLTKGSEIAVAIEKNASLEDVKQMLLPRLSEVARTCFFSLPWMIQEQLLTDKDPHGNIQASKIETERLMILLVERILKERKAQNAFSGHFSAIPIFCGYEGRSALPSNFDANYCYALGAFVAILIRQRKTGYMASMRGLTMAPEQWTPIAAPLQAMMHIDERNGTKKAVIQRTLVDTAGKVFAHFAAIRGAWRIDDAYRQVGPIQYLAPAAFTERIPMIMKATSGMRD